MYFVYVVESETTGRHYTGLTSDLRRRIAEHNQDSSTSTKHRGPWRLLYEEEFQSLPEAVRRERFFKTGKGREELKRILLDQRPAGG